MTNYYLQRAINLLSYDSYFRDHADAYAQYFMQVEQDEKNIPREYHQGFWEGKRAYGLARQRFEKALKDNQLPPHEPHYVSDEEKIELAKKFVTQYEEYASLKTALNFTYPSVERFYQEKILKPQVNAQNSVCNFDNVPKIN